MGFITTVTVDYLPGCKITKVWPAISVFIENYEGNGVLSHAQKCLERQALELGANGIIGFRLTSSSTYDQGDWITPEVFAYGTPILWTNETQDCIVLGRVYEED